MNIERLWTRKKSKGISTVNDGYIEYLPMMPLLSISSFAIIAYCEYVAELYP